ncbi:hypothetical protein Pla123a_22990 [Posidoniimonas polymericola]|uniref:Outer membrane protein beta-barrel domain-containing protein n=2 Tax=Posidoniimonas polymericola TaxID=2528002 RepID=A0A5C5YPP8_9BACT|nr:hypothetical protein Pla123a_22990 [Posidoniimonas polymericola]
MALLLAALAVTALGTCLAAQPARSVSGPGEPLPPPVPTHQPEPIDAPSLFAPNPPEAVSEFAAAEDCPDCYGDADCYTDAEWQMNSGEWLTNSLARFHEFTSRNSATHGRATGLGRPLRGTSWLNRPYEASLDFGAFLMTNHPAAGVQGAHDKFAALTLGWDWDHYWGTQARLGWSTPELGNSEGGSDNLLLTDLSLMYYPWGDSAVRPYWRMGMGLTDIEFTNVNGVRQQEFLFTIPFGVGMKYQIRRWAAWKVEMVDNLALGVNGANTMNNFTLTCGFEARYGGRPGGYWAWQPRGYSW